MKRYRTESGKLSALRFTFYASSAPKPSPSAAHKRKPIFWFDPYLILLLLFSVPAITPLLQPTITQSADGLLHLYRLVALRHAIEQGALFPRWLPDLAFGYGFPLFVFYAPLSYYLTLLLSLGSSTVAAFNASFGLALLLSGTGLFLLVSDRFGSGAGLVAGVAYVYAPFQLFNAFSRGGLPAAWSMALFPFVFWAFGRLIWSTGQPRSVWWTSFSAVTLGLALLAHNTLTLLFAPLLAVYVAVGLLVRFITRRGSVDVPAETASSFNLYFVKQLLLPVGSALALGIGLAAFFLLPALIEQPYAQVHRVITSPDFDFRFHFVSLPDLFSFPTGANTGLLNPKFPLTLGLAQVTLAALGLGGLGVSALIARSRPRSSHSVAQLTTGFFAAGVLAVTIFMMLPISLPLWERLPLLAFVQFPHRLLGPAAFLMAILAGAGVGLLPQRPAFWLMLLGIASIFFSAVPLLYPRYNISLPADPSLVDMMAYEQRRGAIGTTSFGEYLPIWVEQTPRESPLEPMYQAAKPVERFDTTYLPPGATLESSRYGFNHVELVVNSPEPFQAIFHTFYFPGWTARIDNRPVPVTPYSERGLIRVDVPGGQHQVSLTFQNTRVRQVGIWLSVGALIIVLGLLVVAVVRGLSSADFAPDQAPRASVNSPELVTLVTIACCLIALKFLYFDPFDTPLKRTFDGTVTNIDAPRRVEFGDRFRLLGYDLTQAAVEPGQSFDLTLYWQARQPVDNSFSALAHLVDAEQHLYAGQDNLHPGGSPTVDWLPWGFVQDPHAVVVPFGTPPGEYFLTTGLYDPATGRRLPVVTGGDPGWSDVVAIPVTVEQLARRPSLAELDIAWPQRTDLNSELRLLGATPEREQIVPNDFLRVALFWEAVSKPTANYTISLRLVDAQDGVVLEQSGQPSHNRYPTGRWSPGERVRDNHALWIPADFPPGRYRLQVQVVDEMGQPLSQWVNVGELPAGE